MKILTNIRFAQTAGICQVLSSFIEFIKKNHKNDIKLIGVNMINDAKEDYRKNTKGNVSIISVGLKRAPKLANVLKRAGTIDDIAKKYRKIINIYRRAIKSEKVNVVLVNGTYYMPWCLFLAARLENIPVVLHYHGVLTKETQGWEKRERKLFKEMEKSFDKENVFYIFPSMLTKRVVEKEVFGHRIKKYAVLPNPVPNHFFGKKSKNNGKKIGIVSRWTRIKNIDFIVKLAEYNESQGGKFNINLITDIHKRNNCLKGLSKNIKIHKERGNKKLADFYRDMDVIISPSHFETYGNVAKEAIASGTPAIVNNNMGVKETFKKLELNHLVINFDSVEKVYKEIENIIGTNISTEIRSQMKKLYSPDKIFGELVDMLKAVESC